MYDISNNGLVVLAISNKHRLVHYLDYYFRIKVKINNALLPSKKRRLRKHLKKIDHHIGYMVNNFFETRIGENEKPSNYTISQLKRNTIFSDYIDKQTKYVIAFIPEKLHISNKEVV